MDAYQEITLSLRENRWDRAGELCRELLAAGVENVELISLAGTLAYREGDAEGALRRFSRAAALDPAMPELRNNLGVVLESLGRYQEAVSRYREALALRPRYCEASCNLGNALRSLKRHEEAISCYHAAISIDAGYAEAHLGLAHVLRAEGRWQEAVDSYRRLLELQPGHLAGWMNLGGALLALNRFDEAIDAEGRALAIDPGSADAHWNLAFALLATGDYRQGWREYEWRLRRPGTSFTLACAGKPMWDGSNLNGRTLLVRAEQGFGDALQMFRYVLLLARQGERVVLECREELLPLFAAQHPDLTCFAAGATPPPFDTFAYLMSLPYLLHTTVEGIPAQTAYLTADSARVSAFAAKLPARGAMRVGLVWAGSAGFLKDRERSLPLRLLSPLAALSGIELYSLQVGPPAAELAREPWGAAVRDLAPELRDFADTAALIANVDLVVSVDTAVAHLAAALGKPVLVMLPYASDWRWLHDRGDSPWYPTMRLYRQETLGEWAAVITAIGRELSPDPGDMNRLFRQANALSAAGLFQEAIAAYRRLLALRPDLAEVHNNLGLAWQDLGHLDEAAASYRRAVELKPELADAHNNLGTVLVSRGDREGAIPFFRKALESRQEFIPAYVNLGSSLQYLELPEEAVPVYERALSLRPDAMEARINLGNCYQELMQPEAAVAVFEEALRRDPGHPEAHWNLALSLLCAGDFERGWREYEWRLQHEGRLPDRNAGSFSGKRVLLECEQGLGDTLQFVRYAPLVAALGAEVVLQCQYPSLKPLLSRVEGVAAVLARGEELPRVDCRLPLLSLPRVFGTTLQRLPATVPYLTPELGRVTKWRSRVGGGSDFKVGLVWRGGPLPRNRACPYPEFAPLAGVPGVSFYALQLGEAPDRQVLPATDLASGIADFGDSAAILANLDLVVTVDTAMAHLAGGMGVPVWTMLPYACDWRWMVGRRDSPWYPSMRLFRQQRRGDWRSVIMEIRSELAELGRGEYSRVDVAPKD